MPDEVIKRVEQLGKKDNQPDLLVNTDKKGDTLIENEEAVIEDDLSYDEMSYESGDPTPIDEIPGVEYDSEFIEESYNDNVEPSKEIGDDDDISETTPEPEVQNLRRNIISNITVPRTNRKRVMDVESNPFSQVQPGGDVIPNISNSDLTTGEGRPIRSRNQPKRMNISSNKGNSYDIALVQAICLMQIAEAVKAKRMSLNKGLKLWGEKGWNAVEAELSQIHNRAVFEPLDFTKLTWEGKKQALESHLFLEKKKDNVIKGRIVGRGNKQRQ